MRTWMFWAGLFLVGARAASAGPDRKVVLDGMAELAYCGPCLTAWVTGVTASDTITFGVRDEGVPGDPRELPGQFHESGLGWVDYPPLGGTEVTAYVSGEPTDPRHCSPPIHPTGDCPPPPMKTALHASREGPVRAPISRGLPVATVRLDYLNLETPARWEPLPIVPRISEDRSLTATFDVHGILPGIYRTHALDSRGAVLEVRLIRVE